MKPGTLSTLIAACSDWNEDYLDALSHFAFRDAILCWYTDQLGTVLPTLMVFGAINSALYVRQQSMLIPFVLTLGVGSIFIANAGGIGAMFGTAVTLIIFGLFPVLLIRYLVR